MADSLESCGNSIAIDALELLQSRTNLSISILRSFFGILRLIIAIMIDMIARNIGVLDVMIWDYSRRIIIKDSHLKVRAANVNQGCREYNGITLTRPTVVNRIH